MYEHAIPQNIMEYEFKLFAGLSLRQFVYVAAAGAIAFALFQLNKVEILPSFFAWILIPIVVLVGIILGLGSYQKRTMEEWLTAYVRNLNTPLRRVWKKGTDVIKKEQFFSTKPAVLPNYLAAYFMNADEYKKLMRDAGSVASPGMISQIQDQPQIIPTLEITSQNITDYADMMTNIPKIPNTLVFRIIDDNLPIEGVVAYMKDQSNAVVAALRSNADGIIYFNQGFNNGVYEIDFQSDALNFPRVRILLEGNTYPLINLSPITV